MLALAPVTSRQVEASLKEQRVDEVVQSQQSEVQLYPFQTAYPKPTLATGKCSITNALKMFTTDVESI